MNQIIDIGSFCKGLNANCLAIFDEKIANSEFTTYVSQGSKVISTKNYKNTFVELEKEIKKKSKKRRFIQVYVSEFDSIAHEEGVSSKEANEIFWDLDKRIKKLAKSIKKTNTLLIVVSDHGFIDTSAKKEIWLEDIKGLKECLTIPLVGEPRVRDCFVRPSRVNDFENIVKTKMSKYCWCFKGEQLIKDNFYGLGTPNKKLFDRVGDYVLIMKENYILMDRLSHAKKQKGKLKGIHGGVSDDEMGVPLICINC